MTLHILSEKEKKEILQELRERFGISKIDGLIIMVGKERLFLFQGSLKEDEIKELESLVPIERAGIYFAKIQDKEIRLSIDGTNLFKNQITKNIFEISNEKNLNEWMHGSEILVKTDLKGYVVMKYKDNFLGCGKASAEKITNFVPKNRRLKFKD